MSNLCAHKHKMLNIEMLPEVEDDHREKRSLSCSYLNGNFLTYQETRLAGFLMQREAGVRSEACTYFM